MNDDEILRMVGGDANESVVGVIRAIKNALSTNGKRDTKLFINLDMSRVRSSIQYWKRDS